MKIVAHSLVKNEDRWIWYSLMSVVDFVDEIMVWDTGSTDKTKLQISNVKSQIKSDKIKFKERIAADPFEMTKARQEMLDETKADWLMILDGDEIWPEASIKASLESIRSQPETNYLVSRYYELLGDVYHRQEEIAGRYHIGRHCGHITIRFINLKKFAGLNYHLRYPDESLMNSDGVPIQDIDPKNTVFAPLPYLHSSHLKRTSLPTPQTISRSHKVKYELGLPIPDDFEYPKCFYYPSYINPWKKRSWSFVLNASWQTPLKLLKRRFWDRIVA